MSLNKFQQISISFFFISIFYLLFSSAAQAAVLYAGSASQTISEGQTFVIDWFLDTADQDLNTLDLRLKFSTDVLEVVQAEPGHSILNLWIQSPAYSSDGMISLIGGSTGGFRGQQVPVFHTVFRAKKSGNAKISMQAGSAALVADGRGTPAKLVFQELNFTVAPRGSLPIEIKSPTHPDSDEWYQDRRAVVELSPAVGEVYSYTFSANPEIFPDNEPDEIKPQFVYENLPDGIYYFKLNSQTGSGAWQETGMFRLQIDATPPEEFEPLVSSDPAVYDGQPFLSFSTVDKTSGILHYQIKFGSLGGFHETQSPQKISKPLVGDYVTVTAVDQAGNVREVTIPYKARFPSWLFIVLVISFLVAGFLIAKKIVKTK